MSETWVFANYTVYPDAHDTGGLKTMIRMCVWHLGQRKRGLGREREGFLPIIM
jgi:hypothetical protein